MSREGTEQDGVDTPGPPQPAKGVNSLLTQPRPGRALRAEQGRLRRAEVPLEAHCEPPNASIRGEALRILRGQESNREKALVPLRYERMATDPFAYLRGAAGVMASDLGSLPHSGITTQLCGDAHLANFGLFGTTERGLVFDLNDFDETLQGPFEWDLKRLAASIVVAGRVLGHSDKGNRRSARAAVGAYRKTISHLAGVPVLTAWATRLDAETLSAHMKGSHLEAAIVTATKKASRRTSDSATIKLTERVGNRRRFRSEPPALIPVPDQDRDEVLTDLEGAYSDYLRSVPIDLVALLARFTFTDLAHKIVGVGSVGTRALVLLLESGDGEPLMLQMKQAGASALEPHLAPSPFTHAGRRVVSGQKALQAAGDPFLGYCRGGPRAPFDFYIRQLHDNKASIDLTRLDNEALRTYSTVCGAVLARAHARAGDAATIAGYLGTDDTFDRALAQFAEHYAELTERDLFELQQWRRLPNPPARPSKA